ncbi:MAG: hypothetical protein ABI682_15890 [Acidobacteriota bacterium]
MKTSNLSGVLRGRLHDRKTLMLVGMACLVLAGFFRWFLRSQTGGGQDAIDAGTGVLFGLAIGCLLLSLRRARRV